MLRRSCGHRLLRLLNLITLTVYRRPERSHQVNINKTINLGKVSVTPKHIGRLQREAFWTQKNYDTNFDYTI